MKLPLPRRLQAAAILAAFFCQGLVSLLPAQSGGVPQLMNYQGRVTVAGTNFDGQGWFKFALVDGGADQNRPAAATATITSSGRVSGLILTAGGRGYRNAPAISFAGTGTGATASASITDGEVTELTLDATGSGYSTVTPTQVVFTAPPPEMETTTFWTNDGSAKLGLEPESAVPLTVQKGLYAVLLGDEALMQALTPQIFANADVRLRVWFSQEEGGPFTLLTPDQRIAAVGYALMANDVRDGAITSAKLAADAITMAQLSPELREAITSLQAWQATQLPIVTSAGTADSAIEAPFSYQITASGSPLSYGATGLPAGLTVNTATGVVTGTPPAAGTVTFSVTATNVAGTSAPKAVTLTVAGAVYVDYATGLDGNAGTQAAPVKTVAQGLAVSGSGPAKRPVFVSGAAQPLDATLQLTNGARVKGGYDRAAGWTRTAPRTPLSFNPPNPPNPGGTRRAVDAVNLNAPTLLDGFVIASPATSGVAGTSSAGVRVVGCQALTLSNNTITAGSAGHGTSGSNGKTGKAGTDGENANNKYGADGGDGGQDYGTPGYVRGGDGGSGGRGAYSSYEGVLNAAPGYAGEFDGGSGGAWGSSSPPSAGNGQPGGNASAAAHGSPGAAPPATLSLGQSFQPRSGGTGSTGQTGKGGGGGGGGGRTMTGVGGGGGGGGGGGSPGTGGLGGTGGGGSFGVIVITSSVTVTGCQLSTGDGGNGAAGGNGAPGGPGGEGGQGDLATHADDGDGGDGGDGGTAGSGGGGAGGPGGPSIGIITSSGSTLTQTSNTFALGTAGSGGQGGLRGGSFTLRAPGGTIGLLQNILTGVNP